MLLEDSNLPLSTHAYESPQEQEMSGLVTNGSPEQIAYEGGLSTTAVENPG